MQRLLLADWRERERVRRRRELVFARAFTVHVRVWSRAEQTLRRRLWLEVVVRLRRPPEPLARPSEFFLGDVSPFARALELGDARLRVRVRRRSVLLGERDGEIRFVVFLVGGGAHGAEISRETSKDERGGGEIRTVAFLLAPRVADFHLDPSGVHARRGFHRERRHARPSRGDVRV